MAQTFGVLLIKSPLAASPARERSIPDANHLIAIIQADLIQQNLKLIKRPWMLPTIYVLFIEFTLCHFNVVVSLLFRLVRFCLVW